MKPPDFPTSQLFKKLHANRTYYIYLKVGGVGEVLGRLMPWLMPHGLVETYRDY